MSATAETAHPNTLKTHCSQGHEYTPANTYTDSRGWRICRTCRRTWNQGRDRRTRCKCGGPKAQYASQCRACQSIDQRHAAALAGIAALQAWTAEHGRPPGANEWTAAHRQPTVTGLQYTFGSWSEALRAAGLDPTQRMRERVWPSRAGATIRP